MTISNQNNRISYDPDGIQTDFPYDFLVKEKEHMVPYTDGDAYGGAFSITGLGDPVGGVVSFDVAPNGSFDDLTLLREIPLTQQTDYPEYGDFPASSHEDALDKLTMICQQLQEELNRAIKSSIATDPEVDTTFPPYAAGEYWRWSASEKKITTANLMDTTLVSVGLESGDVVQLVSDSYGGAKFPDSIGKIQLAQVYDIGPTGNFGTFNEALEFLSYYRNVYTSGGYVVDLRAQSGFVMAEQIRCRDIDLSWITISSVDAEVPVDGTNITGSPQAVFYGYNAKLPVIDAKFRYTDSTKAGKSGVYIEAGSLVVLESGAGVGNCGDTGLLVRAESRANARSTEWEDCNFGIYVSKRSSVSAESSLISGCGDTAVYATQSSTVAVNGASCQNAGMEGVHALELSTIDAYSVNASGAGVFGFRVTASGLLEITASSGSVSQAVNVWTQSGWIGR